MRASLPPTFRILLVLALPAAIVACAPPPIYKTGPHGVTATPRQVVTAPANFRHLQVIWGGEVIGVTNLQDQTELRILAYPLDSSQRPRLKQPADGRFTAVVPGFLDPMNFPKGSLVTVSGEVNGTSVGSVGQASYVYPSVDVGSHDLHRWTPAEMRQGHPNIRIGVGVGGWIR